MLKVNSVKAIKSNLKVTEKTLYVFDIDNTIITTKSNFGPVIDKIKNINRNYLNIGEIERLISKWRLSREVILTDPDWPDFLRNIDRPYGLTKMDVGHFGEIPSMENWRNNELKRIGIVFHDIYPIDGKIYKEPIEIGVVNATFFNGIFYTGNGLKGDVMKKILANNKYDLVVFIDDRVEQLEDVRRGCNELGVDYLPMQFIFDTGNNYIQSIDEKKYEKEILDFLASKK